MLALYIFLLFFIGGISFFFPIGVLFFRFMCARTVYERAAQMGLAKHIKDKIIIESHVKAQQAWTKKPIEKVYINLPSFWFIRCINRISFTAKTLSADLLVHKKFKKNKTIAVLVHGFAESSSSMAYLAQAYYKKEVSVLAINLRAHGESQGKFCGLGYLSTDSYDISNWVAYLRKRFGNDISIVLHGIAMGGSAVIQSKFGYGLSIKLVVSDSSFSSFKDQTKNRMKALFSENIFGEILAANVVFFASLVNFFVNGFFFISNNPQKVLEETVGEQEPCPLLLFHGARDTVISIEDAQNLYASAREPKKLIVIQNAPHRGSWFYDTNKYMDEIFSYLKDL